MNRRGKTCNAVEERMQSANKAIWKDIKMLKSTDVPWRIKLGGPRVRRFLLWW